MNKIIHGDSSTVLKEIVANSVDLVVTSPSYFNARDYSQYSSVDMYMDIMNGIFSNILNVLKPSRMCCINISCIIVPRVKRSKQSYRIPLPFYFVPMMKEIGFEFLENIIWQKPEGAVKNRKYILIEKEIEYIKLIHERLDD